MKKDIIKAPERKKTYTFASKPSIVKKAREKLGSKISLSEWIDTKINELVSNGK